jgi:GNAT superfamily N-acetyltransferase
VNDERIGVNPTSGYIGFMSGRVHAGRPACKTLELSIRSVRAAHEIAEGAALYERAGRAAFAWRPETYFKAGDFTRFAADEEVWLAFFGQAAVGTLSLFVPDLFIHSLYVDPDAQGMGIGSALVERVRAARGGPLTLKVDTRNHAAIAFYERTGWKPESGPFASGVDEFGVSWSRYRLD